MAEAALASLTHLVLWSAFAVGALFGAVTQRTGFCTMGAVSDIVTMGDWTRMRQWALAWSGKHFRPCQASANCRHPSALRVRFTLISMS